MSIEPPNAGYTIRRLHTLSDAHVRQLAELLIDCVDGGASVSFMHPLSPAKAGEFWGRVAAEVSRGRRALLNLGHTFGHALETAGHYTALLHGEGVAIGMLLAAQLSERLDMSAATDSSRLRQLLEKLGLPTSIPPGMDAQQLLALMRLDKKNTAGSLRLILWRGIGRAEIVAGVGEAEVLAVLQAATH